MQTSCLRIHTHMLSCVRAQVAGAALDVWADEPPKWEGHPLVNRPDVVCTPHLGASTTEAQEVRKWLAFLCWPPFDACYCSIFDFGRAHLHEDGCSFPQPYPLGRVHTACPAANHHLGPSLHACPPCNPVHHITHPLCPCTIDDITHVCCLARRMWP